MVTGAAGFIGSACIWRLNQAGIDDILAVDQAPEGEAPPNLRFLRCRGLVDKRRFIEQIRSRTLPHPVTAIIHMGACSSTTERNLEFLAENNVRYTRDLAEYCLEHGARFVYASSGATYGDGSRGFSDDDATTRQLHPLNPYGQSKQDFDLWALESGAAGTIAGLKFFNVFGPNEYHKGSMTSFVYRAFSQFRQEARVRLFRSDREEFRDGEQRRDFVYVKDCVEVVHWFLTHPAANGIYNVGTGVARTWNALAAAVAAAMQVDLKIEYVDMPAELRGAYQYHTLADTTKLRKAGYDLPFRSLEDAVADYIRNYLAQPVPYLQSRPVSTSGGLG